MIGSPTGRAIGEPLDRPLGYYKPVSILADTTITKLMGTLHFLFIFANVTHTGIAGVNKLFSMSVDAVISWTKNTTKIAIVSVRGSLPRKPFDITKKATVLVDATVTRLNAIQQYRTIVIDATITRLHDITKYIMFPVRATVNNLIGGSFQTAAINVAATVSLLRGTGRNLRVLVSGLPHLHKGIARHLQILADATIRLNHGNLHAFIIRVRARFDFRRTINELLSLTMRVVRGRKR
jgi:hypothetical protein